MTEYLLKNWIAILALIISLGSLCLSYIKNVKDRDYSSDKDLFDQLKNKLRMAHEAIYPSPDFKIPVNDRLQWLIAARHIERYRELKQNLKTKLYKTICEEHEQFWSDQFYKTLNKIPDSKFFNYVNIDEMEEEGIDLRSAAVVYSFAVWNHERHDPISKISLNKIITDYKLYSPINRNFWDYFERIKPEQAKEIKKNVKS